MCACLFPAFKQSKKLFLWVKDSAKKIDSWYKKLKNPDTMRAGDCPATKIVSKITDTCPDFTESCGKIMAFQLRGVQWKTKIAFNTMHS